jgi:2-polyprenyl-6-methoxyphenol hydroxylase-like FAD-dependent oxidoreductase
VAVEEVPVAIVGAGPVGLTLAIRLAQHGVPSILVDAQPAHEAIGSRAICMQRETLEIWNRAGVGERVARRGVQWHIGRTYFGERELFSVELPASTHDHFPPFVNISQTEVEEHLIDRSRDAGVDLRWGWRLAGLVQDADGVDATFETDAGARTLRAARLVGTDGAHSTVRHALGLEFRGYSFEDRFFICDIRARLPFPNERRFFFDPPHNPGRQVLVHPQPDDVWRIDWQVPPDTDLDEELRSGGLDDRIRAVIGEIDYELVWATAYRFSQRVVDRFGVGRGFLAGDAAHLMSPFGARGLNSGVADAENLAWKLAWVCRGLAPLGLLDSYDAERRPAALENLAVTDATMRFMVPHGPLRRVWRNIVLRLSTRSARFRRRVNSGRLAQPFSYAGSPIVAPGPDDPSLPRHGEVAPDAPLSDGRLRRLLGDGFVVLLAGEGPAVSALARSAPPIEGRVLAPDDATGAVAAIYAPRGPRGWIIRPDGHLADSAALDAPADLAGLLARLPRAVGR